MEEYIVPSDTPTDEVIAPESEEVGLPKDPVEVEPIDEDIEEREVLKQRNQELYEQLKKAKGFVRDKDGKWVKKETLQVAKEPPKVAEDISRTELYSLVKANVPDEDTNECVIFAKSHGMTVTEALKDDRLKAILKVNAEYRKSAEVANTSGTRKGNIKPSNDQILENASKGVMPQNVDDLVQARIAKKLADMQKS